jgi:hypothetical protein
VLVVELDEQAVATRPRPIVAVMTTARCRRPTVLPSLEGPRPPWSPGIPARNDEARAAIRRGADRRRGPPGSCRRGGEDCAARCRLPPAGHTLIHEPASGPVQRLAPDFFRRMPLTHPHRRGPARGGAACSVRGCPVRDAGLHRATGLEPDRCPPRSKEWPCCPPAMRVVLASPVVTCSCVSCFRLVQQFRFPVGPLDIHVQVAEVAGQLVGLRAQLGDGQRGQELQFGPELAAQGAIAPGGVPLATRESVPPRCPRGQPIYRGGHASAFQMYQAGGPLLRFHKGASRTGAGSEDSGSCRADCGVVRQGHRNGGFYR